MRRTNVTFVRNVVRRIAPIACVAILGVTAAACGDNTPGVGNTPTGTTPSGPAVTTPAAPAATTPAAPATTAPKSGGAGF